MRTFLIVFLTILSVSAATADPGDTTVVITFAQELHNFGSGERDNIETFTFPGWDTQFDEVYMIYRLDCPGPPGGDCDPWDRTARLWVQRPLTDTTYEEIEIARLVTPYDITGAGRPGHCEWRFDMLDYHTLLRGDVTLHSLIDTWVGGTQGWLVTCTFYFIENTPQINPFKVEKLYDIGYLVYGNPENPVENYLDMSFVPIPPQAEFATVRIWTTGHGQGNTHNAAEFSQKTHGVWVGLDQYEHLLWRNDCATNPCSPQGGTWQFNRAGWCPGSRVYPWDVPFIEVTPGQTLDVWPTIEDFDNQCRPNNPECQSGITCADCNYNSTGHTEPYYVTSGQVIFYTTQQVDARPTPPQLPDAAVLHQNYPNPFNPETTISFAVNQPGIARVRVFDVQGREVAELLNHEVDRGQHRLRFNGAGLASGVYFTRLETQGQTFTNKMLLLK